MSRQTNMGLRREDTWFYASLFGGAIFFAWKITKQTSAEQFQQSSRYDALRQCLRDKLRNFRLQRLPRSIWLYLLRLGRVSKAKPGHAHTKRNHELPEASFHSTTSIQYIQSGTLAEFSIQSKVSNEQSHLCTSMQRVSNSCSFICIAGLRFFPSACT